MFCTLLKGKIHRATVTRADVHYTGSITVDPLLLEAAGIHPYEKVQVVSVDSGARLETYAIEGERGSGTVQVNGAAALLIREGERVIVMAYVLAPEPPPPGYSPSVVWVDGENRIERTSRDPVR